MGDGLEFLGPMVRSMIWTDDEITQHRKSLEWLRSSLREIIGGMASPKAALPEEGDEVENRTEEQRKD